MPHAKIFTHQAKYTLELLHKELAGKILDNKQDAIRVREPMEHVEAVLKLLDPNFSSRGIAVRRKVLNPYFKRGTMFRTAMEIMRKAGKPLPTREIAMRMLASKGIAKPRLKDLRNVIGAVQCSLRSNEGKVVVSDGKMPARWTLKE